MRMRHSVTRFFTFAIIAFVCSVFASCNSDDPATGSGSGIVKVVDHEHRMITLDHGRIPKIMGPMVMAYRVDNPQLLDMVLPGDSVSFTLHEASPGDYVIASITKRQAATAPPSPKPSSAAPKPKK